MKLAIELADTPGYGHIHKAACRDLKDAEHLGDATTRAQADELAAHITGWDAPYTYAPCVKLRAG